MHVKKKKPKIKKNGDYVHLKKPTLEPFFFWENISSPILNEKL